MKKILFSALAVLVVLSCSSGSKSVVNVTVSDVTDSTQVIVYKLNVSQLKTVDTLYIVGGKATCQISPVSDVPDFYYVDLPGKCRAALVLSAGQKIDVNLDDSSVSGSEESVLFNKIENDFSAFTKQISDKTRAFSELKDPDARKSASEDIAKSYINFKKESVKYVMTHISSITNIPVLFRKVSDVPVFGDINDIFLMQKVYDTLSVVYPESPYVMSLKNEIDSRKNRKELSDMITSAQTVSFPDISLPDVNGKQRSLSEIDDKVVLLLFWNSQLTNITMMNAELRDMYAKYRNSGFEIFQVALDPDKTQWAASIKSQDIQWISVVDTRGSQSTYVPLYYVTELPYAYVMDKKGNIIDKGKVDISRLERVVSSAIWK